LVKIDQTLKRDFWKYFNRFLACEIKRCFCFSKTFFKMIFRNMWPFEEVVLEIKPFYNCSKRAFWTKDVLK
jgi:hypothetical protein